MFNTYAPAVPAGFDADGNYFYYFDNESEKKFTVDIINRKVVK